MSKVTITGFVANVNKTTGETFYSLILSGAPEAVVSENGNMRIETPSVRLTTPMTEEQCKFALGQQMNGRIAKTTVEPYTFTNAKGEEVTSTIRRIFIPEGQKIQTAVVATAATESELAQ